MGRSRTYALTACQLGIVEYSLYIRFTDTLAMEPGTRPRPYISSSRADKPLKYR